MFDWRNRNRKIALTFHICWFICSEIVHGIFIYALYLGFWESNREMDIFRVSSDIIAILICLSNSFQCSWMHIKFIYTTSNNVSWRIICKIVRMLLFLLLISLFYRKLSILVHFLFHTLLFVLYVYLYPSFLILGISYVVQLWHHS